MGVLVTSAVKTKNLSFKYRRASQPALQDVTFEVERGEIFGLLGPNGGGKTTLFKILSTVFVSQPGTAEILGLDTATQPGEVRKKIGVVFQSPSLDKKLSVKENLVHHGHLYGLSGSILEKRISEVLEKVLLSSRSKEMVETLSGGLARRLEIAKGLLHSPEVLLMDEPTTGLDPGARIDFWKHISEIQSSGVTVMFTTHLMEETEKCDRLAILSEGKVVALGSPQALKNEIGGEVITVEIKNPEWLIKEIEKKFNLKASILDGSVRIEREKGHEFVPEIVKISPDDILSVRVSRPTLEDVFVHRTGHKFWRNGN